MLANRSTSAARGWIPRSRSHRSLGCWIPSHWRGCRPQRSSVEIEGMRWIDHLKDNRLENWGVCATPGKSAVSQDYSEGDTSSRQVPEEYRFFADNAPSWSELEKLLEERKSSIGFVDPNPETGPPNAHSLRRTFGSTEPIRIKLYRDHAAWCPYCQKVWMQLEEKRIPYEIEKVNMDAYGDKDPAFLELAPAGLVPVLEYEGEVIADSAPIIALLEREFPDIPLLPDEGTPDSKRVEAISRLEKQSALAWLNWLNDDDMDESLRSIFISYLKDIDDHLAVTPGSYFLEDFSMVDVSFAPFLERMDASNTYYKGYMMRKNGVHKNIARWFEAMETRPTYIATKSDYYTLVNSSIRVLSTGSVTKEGNPFAARVDGGEWSFPLEPLSSHSFEPYSPGEDPPLDKYLAARQLVKNRTAVTRFACRAGGDKGAPVKAPLSNPNAIPNDDMAPAVESALRHVVHALLVGIEIKQHIEPGIFTARKTPEHGDVDGSSCYSALEYLRGRVGVPRDLNLPSARQLRAHLTWVMDHLKAT